MTRVTNIETLEVQTYSCSPEEAVIAAHAQAKKDFNTWDYARRYGHLVTWAKHHVTCGDFTSRRDAFEVEDG